MRGNCELHTSDECPNSVLLCTNNECQVNILRKQFEEHITHQCPKRIVQCSFAKYGCAIQNLKFEEQFEHERDAKLDHISLQNEAQSLQLAQQKQSIAELQAQNKQKVWYNKKCFQLNKNYMHINIVIYRMCF
jgi:hypothetical protein